MTLPAPVEGAARAALAKKAEDVVALDLRSSADFTDFFLLLSGQNQRQLVAIADARSWFTYYHFLDDDRAPDYARTVDIHRKPGYDPCELFIDPALKLPKLAIAKFLLKKKLGLRGLLEVIPLNATLVKGSHGMKLERCVKRLAERNPLALAGS